jgi:peroxiredoxin
MATQEATTIRVGDRLPSITLPRLGGGEAALDGLRGKRRLLYMWGSW